MDLDRFWLIVKCWWSQSKSGTFLKKKLVTVQMVGWRSHQTQMMRIRLVLSRSSINIEEPSFTIF